MMSTFSIFLLWLVGSSEERKWESERFLNVFIFVRPLSWGLSVGQEASISCRSNYPGFFYVTKDGWTWKHRGILSARYAEFLISYMNREDTGVYTCCCRFYNNYQDETRCSESVELLITDPDLPRPRISLIPSRMAVIGSNITFQCLLQDRHENVYLHKTGAWQKPQEMESHGSTAVFHIRNVSPGDGGTFSCSYRLSSEFLVSNPSVPEKLWVLDPTLPKPSITLTPEKGSLGGKVSIDCKSSRKVEHFYLQRPGHQSLLQGPVAEGIWARFTIQNVSKKHTGNYSCMYKPLFSKHPVFSLPSDPVTLLLPADTHMNNAIAAGVGVAVPVLFLGLGATLWYKKKKAGKRQSTAQMSVERSFRVAKVLWKAKPVRTSANESGPKEKLPPGQDFPTETQDVIYVEMKQIVPCGQSEDDSAEDSDGCVYATVVPR